MILQLHDVYDPNKASIQIRHLRCCDIIAKIHAKYLVSYCTALIYLQINVKIKIVSGTPHGPVAAEAKKSQANWVVLDK